jgi:hypothetical protein
VEGQSLEVQPLIDLYPGSGRRNDPAGKPTDAELNWVKLQKEDGRFQYGKRFFYLYPYAYLALAHLESSALFSL